MTTPRRTSTCWKILGLFLPLVLIASGSLAVESTAHASASGTGCVGNYGWPVRPFDEAHPIRGGFGDPRTVFTGPASKRTLMAGEGVFSFHQGLDISAPDGSPVYAVASGTVVRARGGRVTVDCGTGRSFQYWHIDPVARAGQRAVAGKTLLGFVQPKREHIHLTQLQHGLAVNPLAPQRLSPYRDTTMPAVVSIAIRRKGAMLSLSAEAVDWPALQVPGRWHGFPVTPALVAWRVEDSTGRIVLPTRVARDVREILPKNDRFWSTFARGTHQNWPVYAGHKEQGLAGRYLFKLSTRALDTHRLRDGVYDLVVTAEDIAGNKDVRRFRFTVHNDAGWR